MKPATKLLLSIVLVLAFISLAWGEGYTDRGAQLPLPETIDHIKKIFNKNPVRAQNFYNNRQILFFGVVTAQIFDPRMNMTTVGNSMRNASLADTNLLIVFSNNDDARKLTIGKKFLFSCLFAGNIAEELEMVRVGLTECKIIDDPRVKTKVAELIRALPQVFSN